MAEVLGRWRNGSSISTNFWTAIGEFYFSLLKMTLKYIKGFISKFESTKLV
jgi:hypothetical protein